VWTQGQTKVWVGGLAQSNKNPANDETASSFGASGGVRFGSATFSVTGSGYYGKGLGTTLLFNAGAIGGAGGGDDLRTSYGYIGQVTFTPANSKVTIAGSWGSSFLENADNEADGKTENSLASGGIYFQATKSLKVVGEVNYAWTDDDVDGNEKNTSLAPAFGFMLFF
ncbi:MAG TPA: hypothetical protein VFT84_05070, partial [Gemmatimonadales bacterium]|nr:hypothetical protein [Gemmatimonadales bacterium]